MSGGGKGGGGSTPSNSNTTGWNTTWGSGSNAAQTELNGANSLYDSGNLLSPYAQPLAQDAYNTAATPTGLNNSNQIYGNLADPNSATNTNLQSLASGGSMSPYLDNTYSQAAGSVQNSLAGQFNSAGRLGSGAQEFNTSQGLNNLANTVYGSAYQDDQSRALSADQSLQSGQETAAQGMSNNYNSLLGAYGTASGLGQAASGANALSQYSSLINPYINLNNTTQQNTRNYQNTDGSFQNDLGYVSALASVIPAAAASDARLKRNIIKLYDDDRGFGVYEYDIEDRHEIGVLAQELEEVMPWLVIKNNEGIRFVNYEGLQR